MIKASSCFCPLLQGSYWSLIIASSNINSSKEMLVNWFVPCVSSQEPSAAVTYSPQTTKDQRTQVLRLLKASWFWWEISPSSLVLWPKLHCFILIIKNSGYFLTWKNLVGLGNESDSITVTILVFHSYEDKELNTTQVEVRVSAISKLQPDSAGARLCLRHSISNRLRKLTKRASCEVKCTPTIKMNLINVPLVQQYV